MLRLSALGITAVVLGLCLEKQGKDFALLLTVAAGALILSAAMRYMVSFVDLIRSLTDYVNLDMEWVGILLKIMGIGLITELSSTVCADAGRASVGKALQFTGSFAILWLAAPIYMAMLELIGQILGGL